MKKLFSILSILVLTAIAWTASENYNGALAESQHLYESYASDEFTDAGMGNNSGCNINSHGATGSAYEIRKGLATRFPGNEGIEMHKSVVFTENFEASSISEVAEKWTWNQGINDHRLSLDSIP